MRRRRPDSSSGRATSIWPITRSATGPTHIVASCPEAGPDSSTNWASTGLKAASRGRDCRAPDRCYCVGNGSLTAAGHASFKAWPVDIEFCNPPTKSWSGKLFGGLLELPLLTRSRSSASVVTVDRNAGSWIASASPRTDRAAATTSGSRLVSPASAMPSCIRGSTAIQCRNAWSTCTQSPLTRGGSLRYANTTIGTAMTRNTGSPMRNVIFALDQSRIATGAAYGIAGQRKCVDCSAPLRALGSICGVRLTRAPALGRRAPTPSSATAHECSPLSRRPTLGRSRSGRHAGVSSTMVAPRASTVERVASTEAAASLRTPQMPEIRTRRARAGCLAARCLHGPEGLRPSR